MENWEIEQGKREGIFISWLKISVTYLYPQVLIN